jgi:hypothetical protein
MRKFKVEVGYCFDWQVIDNVIIEAKNELDLIKKVRSNFRDYCYDDKDLVEWIESGDNWDREVDDKFLSECIDKGDSELHLALAEDIYFDCVELK